MAIIRSMMWLFSSSSSESDIMENAKEPLLPCSTTVKKEQWHLIDQIPSFVPEYEGLRGMAILMTMYAHIGSIGAKDQHIKHVATLNYACGQMGVCLFMVLSGFLITGVLRTHQAKKKDRLYAHLLRFYTDRSVRLYPALLLMVLSTLAFRWYWTNGALPASATKDAVLALTYMTDLYFLFPSADVSYGNTWSLSVEEHFYIVWALVLPLLMRIKSHRARACTLLSLFLLSFSAYAVRMIRDDVRPIILLAEVGPLANFWKLLVGASLRLLFTPVWLQRAFISYLGLLLVAIMLIAAYFDPILDTTSWTFLPRAFLSVEELWMVVAALAASMIVCGSLSKHGNAFLRWHSLRFIGRISYSAYLYQYTIIYIATPNAINYTGFATTCVALVCATISTLYVEEPIRDAYKRWKARK